MFSIDSNYLADCHIRSSKLQLNSDDDVTIALHCAIRRKSRGVAGPISCPERRRVTQTVTEQYEASRAAPESW